MADRRGSAYLGSRHGRWSPSTWAEVVEAAAGGLLDESHWVDLKLKLDERDPKVNAKLAKDFAAFAVEGGLLVFGIEDDSEGRAGEVRGTALAGLADRVEQIARDKVRPSVAVLSTAVEDPGNPGHGCLLVHIPRSPDAPHMVDHTYYGRGDRANIRLSDEQVRTLIAARDRDHADIAAELETMVTEDPIPERECGHLYLLAHPVAAPAECLADFLLRSDALAAVNDMLSALRRGDVQPNDGIQYRGVGLGGSQQTLPDLVSLRTRRRRADSVAFTTIDPRDPVDELKEMDLVLREDGGCRLTFGGAVHTRPAERLRRHARVVRTDLVSKLTCSYVEFVGAAGDQLVVFRGTWQLGVKLTDTRDAYDDSKLRGLGPLDPYPRASYERTTTATTDELVNSPRTVAHRLLGPLLRGLGVADITT